MPRTYYEFKKAQWDFAKANAEQIAAIPYPNSDSVFYNRMSNNPYWARRYEVAYSGLHPVILNYQAENVAQLFADIAAQERAKEEALLARFLPASELRGQESLIDKINILMQGRDRYNKILNRIQSARSKEKTKGAPNMSSFFATYLEPFLIQNMEKFQEEFIRLEDPKARYEQLIQDAIKKASNQMAKSSVYEYDVSKKRHTRKRSDAGGHEDWKEINQALHSVPGMWELFVTNVSKAIGNWDKLYSRLINDNTDTASNHVKNQLMLQNRTFSIGGNVAENAYTAVAAMLNGLRGSNGSISYEVAGGALTPEQHTVNDAFLIFSADSTISAQNIFDELNTSDEWYDMQLDKAIDTFRNNMDNLFGIFVNAKNYALGKSQDAVYEIERSGSFEELPTTLDELGVKVSNVYDFLRTAYNTGEDAVFDHLRDAVEDSVVAALRVGAAKLMFDDVATIGNVNNGNIIHLYQLSGKYIPSSAVFQSLADATRAASVTAQVTLPDGVEDEGPEWEKYEGTDAEIKRQIYEHWNEEIKKAHAASTWYFHFVLNIKTALNL